MTDLVYPKIKCSLLPRGRFYFLPINASCIGWQVQEGRIPLPGNAIRYLFDGKGPFLMTKRNSDLSDSGNWIEPGDFIFLEPETLWTSSRFIHVVRNIS